MVGAIRESLRDPRRGKEHLMAAAVPEAYPSPDTKQTSFAAGQLRRIRRLLQAQRTARIAQLNELDRADMGGATPLHPAEADSIAEQVRTALADIDFSLQQLSDGRYGICRECEEPIALPRLEALPATTLCLPCQRSHERRHR
jgi:RNA polymerase-binding transcription factor DksA